MAQSLEYITITSRRRYKSAEDVSVKAQSFDHVQCFPSSSRMNADQEIVDYIHRDSLVRMGQSPIFASGAHLGHVLSCQI